jgi:hypothetical protein
LSSHRSSVVPVPSGSVPVVSGSVAAVSGSMNMSSTSTFKLLHLAMTELGGSWFYSSTTTGLALELLDGPHDSSIAQVGTSLAGVTEDTNDVRDHSTEGFSSLGYSLSHLQGEFTDFNVSFAIPLDDFKRTFAELFEAFAHSFEAFFKALANFLEFLFHFFEECSSLVY